MTKTSKTLKKTVPAAKHKPATRRAFPYEKVAALWAQEKTIPEIAKAIRRVGKGDDKFHALRIFLSKMHGGRRRQRYKAAVPHQPENFGAFHQGGQEGVCMMDMLGKVFVVQGESRRCLACDLLFTREASREHSVEICFAAPSACPPIPHGVTDGAA